jgi:hypothetical protein
LFVNVLMICYARMDALIIRDRHKLIASLQKRGFSAQQAEGITEAIKEIDASSLASKEDINLLRQEVRELKVSLIQWMIGVQLGCGALTVAVVALV